MPCRSRLNDGYRQRDDVHQVYVSDYSGIDEEKFDLLLCDVGSRFRDLDIT